MRQFISTFCFIVFASLPAYAQQLTQYAQVDKFLERVQQDNDTTYVVNIWATWCRPCVEELPYFFKAEQSLKNEKIKFIFLSMDFKKFIEKSVIPFIKKKKIQSEVGVLTDTDANGYIPKFDENWDGSIPATVIYKGGKKIKFQQIEFPDEQSLIQFIKS